LHIDIVLFGFTVVEMHTFALATAVRLRWARFRSPFLDLPTTSPQGHQLSKADFPPGLHRSESRSVNLCGERRWRRRGWRDWGHWSGTPPTRTSQHRILYRHSYWHSI